MIYGAKGARWAEMKDDAKGNTVLPTYGSSEDFGGINSVNETLNFAEASAYADNAKQLAVHDFSDGTLETGVLARDPALTAKLLGCETDGEGGLSYGGDDNQPFGGFGYYHELLQGDGSKLYEVLFYPKVSAYVEGQDNTTKEDSINWNYEQCGFDVYQAECGKYKGTKTFDTEEAAAQYIEDLFAGNAQLPGLSETTPTSVKAASAKASTKSAD